MDKKKTSLDEILANLERASWESYVRSKSFGEAESRAPRGQNYHAITAVTEAAAKIDERINKLASEYVGLLPCNPRREEIASEISRLRLLRVNLNKKNA